MPVSAWKTRKWERNWENMWSWVRRMMSVWVLIYGSCASVQCFTTKFSSCSNWRENKNRILNRCLEMDLTLSPNWAGPTSVELVLLAWELMKCFQEKLSIWTQLLICVESLSVIFALTQSGLLIKGLHFLI